MTPWFCKAGVQLRQQIDDTFPDRDRTSDGTIGDLRHSQRVSDHNPDPKTGVIRAFDCDKDLSGTAKPDFAGDLADQIRLCGQRDPRISYVIFRSKIASAKKNWAWRPYDGINSHEHHIHISFTPKGDQDGSFFNIPMLGGKA